MKYPQFAVTLAVLVLLTTAMPSRAQEMWVAGFNPNGNKDGSHAR